MPPCCYCYCWCSHCPCSCRCTCLPVAAVATGRNQFLRLLFSKCRRRGSVPLLRVCCCCSGALVSCGFLEVQICNRESPLRWGPHLESKEDISDLSSSAICSQGTEGNVCSEHRRYLPGSRTDRTCLAILLNFPSFPLLLAYFYVPFKIIYSVFYLFLPLFCVASGEHSSATVAHKGPHGPRFWFLPAPRRFLLRSLLE